MLAGTHPFLANQEAEDLSEKDVLDRIVSSPVELPHHLSKEAKSLIKGVCSTSSSLLFSSPLLSILVANDIVSAASERTKPTPWLRVYQRAAQPPVLRQHPLEEPGGQED